MISVVKLIIVFSDFCFVVVYLFLSRDGQMIFIGLSEVKGIIQNRYCVYMGDCDPFFIALDLVWKICSDIGSDQAFTAKNGY